MVWIFIKGFLVIPHSNNNYKKLFKMFPKLNFNIVIFLCLLNEADDDSTSTKMTPYIQTFHPQ